MPPLRASPLALALLVGCGQPILVRSDGGEAARDGGEAARDASRSDAGSLDASGRDGGAPDGSVSDGGPDAGCPAPCFAGFEPEAARIAVGETFRASLAAEGKAAELDLVLDRVRLVRRPGLPPAAPVEIDLDATLDPLSGTIDVLVRAVPPWFTETTVVLEVTARAAAGGPRTAEVDITILGNVVYAHDSRIYAYSSDGRLAGDGLLVDGQSLLRNAEDMEMGRDGLLYVLDASSTTERPQAVKAFELTGPGRLARTLDATDDVGAPLLRHEQIPQGLAVLADGRITTAEWSYGEPDPSRVVLWGPDGRFDRIHLPRAGREKVGPVGDAHDGTMWVVSRRDLIRLDPDDGRELEVFDLGVTFIRGLRTLPDGRVYAGGAGEIVILDGRGGRRMVTGLPGDGGDYTHLDAVGANRIVAAGAHRGREAILVIEGDRVLRPWLAEGVELRVTPSGLAYLD